MAVAPAFAHRLGFGAAAPSFTASAPADASGPVIQNRLAAGTASAGPSFAPQAAPPPAKIAVLFSGVPSFVEGQAVLFDSTGSDDKLPDTGTLSRLEI